jgi:hypothetical protein
MAMLCCATATPTSPKYSTGLEKKKGMTKKKKRKKDQKKATSQAEAELRHSLSPFPIHTRFTHQPVL